jgi:ESS family glutamate:Na+ symporter
MQNAFLFAVGLLLLGFVLRAKLRILQQLYIPASIVGGLVGLALVQAMIALQKYSHDRVSWLTQADWLRAISKDMVGELKTWPGWLIAVIFAGLLLEKESRSFRKNIGLVGRQGLVVWIIVLGQTALGLLATWWLIQPFFDVPNWFGLLIETGFAGGHGTAAAMGKILKELGYQEGQDLGTFMATIGLVFSVVSGIVYVNLAVRRGWTRRGDVKIPILTGLEARKRPESIGRAVVRSEVIDPLVFQSLILAAAFLVGLALHRFILLIFPSTENFPTENFPLFMYTLIGGFVVRKGMDFFEIGDLIDTQSIRRLTSAAMEFLVVAAIVSLDLQAVASLIVPLSILIGVAFLWTGFCLLHVGRKLLPSKYWFELGIINYGMSTGTTATGFVLLRIIDKDFDSGAAEDYALAAPLSAFFVGGGIITFALPALLGQYHIGVVTAVLCAVVFVMYVVGLKIADR